jgi:oligopeptidase B
VPYEVRSPNGSRTDPYYWLRDDSRAKPAVLDYLKSENAYYEAMTARYAPLVDKLDREIVGRIQQDDSTVPYRWKDYEYATRFETGQEYPVYVRRPTAGGPEQILVDANRESAGHGFYQVGARAISPDQTRVAFLEDVAGRRQYTLRVRDIATGHDHPDRIGGLSSAVVWASDGKTLFYVENDPVTLLSTRVKRHVLGADPTQDTVVYEEPDHSYYLDIHKSGDERYLIVTLQATVSEETRFLDADRPESALRVLAARQRDFLYDADHIAGRWVIRTNWDAPNYRLMTVDDAGAGDRARWSPLLPYDKSLFLEDFALFRDYLAINERSEGLLRIRVLPWGAPEKAVFIQSDEPAYVATLDVNPEQDTKLLRYQYSSLATPNTIYDVDMSTGERTLRKRQPVIGYDPTRYTTERVWAVARDGARVPFLWFTAGVWPRTALRRSCSPPTGPTAPRAIRGSTRRPCRCSTAGSSTPSPTCAAAKRWGALGTTTVTC